MSFRDGLNRFHAKARTVSQDVFVETVQLAKESITHGSPLTGAPGQPVDTGALLNSWVGDFIDADHAEITTNMKYAPSIEDGVSHAHGVPLTLRSEVGGFHSVEMTAQHIQNLVDEAVRRVTGGD